MPEGASFVPGKMRKVVARWTIQRGTRRYRQALLECGHTVGKWADRGGKYGATSRCPECREGLNC